MRSSGVIEHARNLSTSDHVCWAFDDRAELMAVASEFLIGGMQLGQRVCYVGDRGDLAALRAALRRAAGSDPAAQRAAVQAVQIVDLGELYPAGAVIEPKEQVAAYAVATAEAQQAGYAGLRVAVDATALVRTPAQRDAFTRYEHLIDRYMRGAPFAAMCAYDRAELGPGVIEELACLHPCASPDAARFRLHAGDAADCAAALGGELDLATRDVFAVAWERADPQPSGGELAVDVRGLRFVDHRHLWNLAAHAERHAATLVLRGPPPGLRHIVQIVGLPHVRVEPAR